MFKILSSILAGLIACVMLSSCDHNKLIQANTKHDSLELKVQFRPAFAEVSEVWLLKTDSTKFIQILIRNDFRVDKSQDTFWFKKIILTDQQYLNLDTSVIKLCSKKISNRKEVVRDGMPISSLLINNGDSNIINRNGPHEKEDSVGYHFVKTLIEIFKLTFHDSLTTAYFNDIESYIDESKSHRADPRRKIDQLRMKKYNWTIIEK